MPKLDLTITLPIILALCALFAPSIIALINNRHQSKIRKMELAHDEYLHQIDEIYHRKYEAYKNFVFHANEYIENNQYTDFHTSALSSLHEALLLCDSITRPLLLDFQKILTKQEIDQTKYFSLLTYITQSLNRELTAVSDKHGKSCCYHYHGNYGFLRPHFPHLAFSQCKS